MGTGTRDVATQTGKHGSQGALWDIKVLDFSPKGTHIMGFFLSLKKNLVPKNTNPVSF